jgi:hypothetical protein
MLNYPYMAAILKQKGRFKKFALHCRHFVEAKF